ncbi:MAG: hypothetical protein SRB2_00925 [Desulfobacteraceae bacterium Eth-SRB2]|nr:MAG: hypothetical protein SRB2_00925 [Desulfobacteraceae bacterium Eth-SRB2]
MRYFLIILSILFMSAEAQAKPLTTNDFAYGLPINVDGRRAVYSITLPKEVYKNCTRSDLGDIRVFNAHGDMVPHTIRRPKIATEKLTVTESVPFFPLVDEEKIPAGDDLSLMITRNTDGTIIKVDSSKRKTTSETKVNAYLLDMSKIKLFPVNLEFTWRNSGDHFITTVDMKHSNDLANWINLTRKNTLAELEFSGNTIRRTMIQLPRKPRKYIHLSWNAGQQNVEITHIKAVSRPLATMIKREWTDLNPKKSTKDDVILIGFESHAHLPVDALQIKFHEANSILHATILSRDNKEAHWVVRRQAIFYRLKMEAVELNNDMITFPQTSDRFWRLKVLQDGSGIEASRPLPVLQLGWRAHELLFIARGPAPYMLAFGSGQLFNQPGKSSSDMILPALKKEKSHQLITPALIGKQLGLGGDKALKVPSPPKPWKKWILWSVLCIGVAVLAWMARSLYCQMNSK